MTKKLEALGRGDCVRISYPILQYCVECKDNATGRFEITEKSQTLTEKEVFSGAVRHYRALILRCNTCGHKQAIFVEGL